MVKCSLDATAAAIASAPRREIVDRLAEGPASMSMLADELDLTMPAIDKHLKVLVGAGLVERDKQGRTTSFTLNPGSLQELATWAMSTRLMWAGLLDRFAAAVEEEPSS